MSRNEWLTWLTFGDSSLAPRPAVPRRAVCAVEKTPEEKLSEAVRDAQIKLLKASVNHSLGHPTPPTTTSLPLSW